MEAPRGTTRYPRTGVSGSPDSAFANRSEGGVDQGLAFEPKTCKAARAKTAYDARAVAFFSADERYVAHVEYVNLDEFINSEPYPPEPGDEFVVENAHMIDEIGRDYGDGGRTFKGLYWLTADAGSDIVTSFRAAADLAEALRPKLSTRPHHLRVECVLVEVSEATATYRSAFATAVEAVGADGKTLWRMSGSKPKSVKIRY